MFKLEGKSLFEFIKVRSKFAALLVAISLFHLPNLSIASEGFIEEVIVTAQKRNKVSTTWVCRLTCLLAKTFRPWDNRCLRPRKVVSGFNANSNYYGSMVYTLRGIGFQDTALASTNTVSLSLTRCRYLLRLWVAVILTYNASKAKGAQEPCSDKTLLWRHQLYRKQTHKRF